jgi:hypothetical protein
MSDPNWREIDEKDDGGSTSTLPVATVDCPSGSLVGYIPYLPASQIPGEYLNLSISPAPGMPWRAPIVALGFGPRFAIKTLFEKTGNVNPPTPPQIIQGIPSYHEFLKTQEYRAAITFAEMRMIRDGGPARVRGYLSTVCGYTPWGDGGSGGKRSYSLGDSPDYQWDTLWGPSEVELKVTLQFRLSRRMDLIQSIPMRGHRAPYAWFEVRYMIPYQTPGSVRVKVLGSGLPSADFYAGPTGSWTPRATRSMLGNKSSEISDFVTAGGSKMAPQGNWTLDEVL